MTKAIEAIVVIVLLIFTFFLGVKCSDSVKRHAGWLFEIKEEEIDLPDLTNEANKTDMIDSQARMESNPEAPAEGANFAPDTENQNSNSVQTPQP